MIRDGQLERLREANWLKGISTLGLMMAGGHDVNSSDGTFNPPTSRAIINLDFYNRQSTTVNRRIYEPPPTAPTSSTRRGRDGSPPRSTSPPFMKPPSPPQPGHHPPLNPPAVDLAPAPEMAPLQPQQHALVESGAPAVPSSTRAARRNGPTPPAALTVARSGRPLYATAACTGE